MNIFNARRIVLVTVFIQTLIRICPCRERSTRGIHSNRESEDRSSTEDYRGKSTQLDEDEDNVIRRRSKDSRLGFPSESRKV